MKTTCIQMIALLLLACGCAAQEVPDYVRKGSEELAAGKINQSIRSFEAAGRLQHDVRPHLWQLGIAYYYANQFADGRDLFVTHQLVNPHDVENAVWHFLCVARLENVEAARKKLIRITGDTRVPMKEVHGLFAGKSDPQAVIDAASRVSDDAQRKNALFYAYLYLGLYEEALGNTAKSKEYIAKAAGEFQQTHYMGKIAQVHAKLRAKAGDTPKPRA